MGTPRSHAEAQAKRYKAEVKVFNTQGLGEILSFTLHADDTTTLMHKVSAVMETLDDGSDVRQ